MTDDIFMSNIKMAHDIKKEIDYDVYIIKFWSIMDLREYLFRHRITVTDFAKRINYSRGYLNEVVSGRKISGEKLAKIIEKETNGEVSVEELMNQEERK